MLSHIAMQALIGIIVGVVLVLAFLIATRPRIAPDVRERALRTLADMEARDAARGGLRVQQEREFAFYASRAWITADQLDTLARVHRIEAEHCAYAEPEQDAWLRQEVLRRVDAMRVAP